MTETQTQGKIDEAEFFLSKFIENYNEHEFKYYLSAFVSAARSISWIMKAEFNKHPLYSTWSSQRQPTEDESILFKLFNGLRITTNKQKPIETHRMVSSIMTVPEGFNAKEILGKEMMVNISAPDKDGNQILSFVNESGEILESEIHDYKIVNNLSDEDDLYNLCERYLTVMKNIYNEWMTIYKVSNE